MNSPCPVSGNHTSSRHGSPWLTQPSPESNTPQTIPAPHLAREGRAAEAGAEEDVFLVIPDLHLNGCLHRVPHPGGRWQIPIGPLKRAQLGKRCLGDGGALTTFGCGTGARFACFRRYSSLCGPPSNPKSPRSEPAEEWRQGPRGITLSLAAVEVSSFQGVACAAGIRSVQSKHQTGIALQSRTIPPNRTNC